MAFFAYKGRDAKGNMASGVLEGADPNVIAEQLFRSGVTPIEITETKKAASKESVSLMERLTARPITSVDTQLFSRQMYTLLKSGVPIMRGLAGLQDSSVNKSFSKIIKDLRENLDQGKELSISMRKHPKAFDNFYLAMIRVGELTGRLEEVFLRLNDHLEFDREMRQRVKSATRYPTFVISAMVMAIFVVNMFVIPKFVKVFEAFNAPLPLMTRILIGLSNFTVQWWPVILFVAVASVFGFKSWVKSPDGQLSFDRWKLKFPIAGKIMLKGTMARFARSFALASRSGVPIVQALTVVSQTVDNAYLSSKVERMRDGVERGESILRTATNAGVFTPIVLQMIAVGEESGSLDDLMDEIAEMYEREVDYELKTLAQQIEPILIVFLGIMITILAMGIFLPIWDLGKAAMKH